MLIRLLKSLNPWRKAPKESLVRYGRVVGEVGDFETKSKIQYWAASLGIRKCYKPLEMEVILVSDRRNAVTQAMPRTDFKIRAYFQQVVLIRPERGSIQRHRYPRLAIAVTGQNLSRLQRELEEEVGFHNIYKFPFFVIKDSPTRQEVLAAMEHFDELTKEVQYVTIIREIWTGWR